MVSLTPVELGPNNFTANESTILTNDKVAAIEP